MSGHDVDELKVSEILQSRSILMKKTTFKHTHMGGGDQNFAQQKLADDLSYRKAQVSEY